MLLILESICRVLRMTMVLPTFPERKVGPTEGYSKNSNHNGMTLLCLL